MDAQELEALACDVAAGTVEPAELVRRVRVDATADVATPA